MAKERQLPETLEIPFIICDNSLNRKGWRLLVEGIDTTGFQKNPVCCVQHDTWSVPVGKWKNLKVENSTFTGVVEFDRNDEEAVKLYWKYKDGYMNAVSLHVIPLTESMEPAILMPGQKYATLTTSELLEISLVTVPGQKNAVKLSSPEGGEYKLNLIGNPNTNSKKMGENQVNEVAKQEIDGLKNKLKEQQKLNAKNLVKLHQQRGVVQDAEVEHLTELAENSYETVEKMLDARTVEKPADEKEKSDGEGKKLAVAIENLTKSNGGGASNERDTWTFLDWYKKDSEGLSLMAEKEPEKYKKLEAEFLKEADKDGLKAD